VILGTRTSSCMLSPTAETPECGARCRLDECASMKPANAGEHPLSNAHALPPSARSSASLSLTLACQGTPSHSFHLTTTTHALLSRLWPAHTHSLSNLQIPHSHVHSLTICTCRPSTPASTTFLERFDLQTTCNSLLSKPDRLRLRHSSIPSFAPLRHHLLATP
jgi:hypothetical protein